MQQTMQQTIQSRQVDETIPSALQDPVSYRRLMKILESYNFCSGIYNVYVRLYRLPEWTQRFYYEQFQELTRIFHDIIHDNNLRIPTYNNYHYFIGFLLLNRKIGAASLLIADRLLPTDPIFLRLLLEHFVTIQKAVETVSETIKESMTESLME